jgi:hypothetical protein
MKTVKLIIAFVFLISTVQHVNAQESKFKIGAKGGVNFSNLYTDNVDDENVLIGFNAGLFAKLPITKFIAIQPEVYFTTKGSELVYNNAFVSGTAKFNLNYIEVPVLIVINLTNNFNLHAGPYLGFLINGKVKNDSNVNVFDFQNNINNDDFNKIDAGLALGLGMDVDKLSVGVRYSYGMTTVGKQRQFNGTDYTFPDGKNSVINLYLGIALN